MAWTQLVSNSIMTAVGPNASHRDARDVPAMSASHPITTELVRHKKPALRARKRHLHAANRRLHSITSSAPTSNLSDTVSPSVLAVLRLITSSNLIGSWTGRSAGFAPFRTLST